jgi:hypothetical protein
MPILPAAQDWIARVSAELLGIWKAANNGTVLVDAQGPISYDTLNAVAPITMAANIAEKRFDIGIEPTALIPSVPTNRTAYVDAANGSDTTGELGERTFPFLTIAAALLAIVTDPVPPSAANPALILVWPGVYDESPLTLPSWVTLASADGPITVTVQATDAAQPLLTMSPSSEANGLTLKGASGTGGIGILISASVTPPLGPPDIRRCKFVDCETGLACRGAGVAMKGAWLDFTRSPGEIMTTAIECSAGAAIQEIYHANIAGSPTATIGAGVLCDGASVAMGSFAIALAEDGTLIQNGGSAAYTTGIIAACDNGARIGATNGFLGLSNVRILDSVSNDLIAEGSSSAIVTISLQIGSQPTIALGSTWAGDWFDAAGERHFEGAAYVGSPGRPAVAAFGGGGIHSTGLRAWHNDNVEAGTFTDVTTELASASGSVINLVPGLGTANSLFVGSDQPLPGIYFDIAQAQVGGTITPKYWTGAAWTAIPRWMTAQAVPPYTPSANALFAATGKQDVRFAALPGDTAKAVNGVLKYWYLFEVTSGLTTIPRVEQVKLHTSHAAHGPDGTLLYYGDARPIVPINLDLSLWNPAVSAPTTATVSYSANVLQTGLRNFTNAVQRSIGCEVALPPQVDTSWPLDAVVIGYPNNTNTGLMDTQLHYVPVPAGSITVGALPGEQTIAVSQAAPGAVGAEMSLQYPLVLPSLIAGIDVVAMTFVRLSTDAFTGDFIVREIKGSARAWRS